MSPSGAEFVKQVKSQIQEVDPSEVQPLLGNGVPIIDVASEQPDLEDVFVEMTRG